MSADSTATPQRPARWELTAILLAALGLRAAAIFTLPSMNFPDEIFQVFEQAHRLVFGYGLVPWEFVDGIRSYVPVYLFAGVFKLVSLFSDRPEAYIGVARLVLALASLAPVVAVYRYASQYGRNHARISALFMAVWFEAVYFAIRPLSEAMAFDLLIPAFCLLQMPAGKRPDLQQWAIGFALAGAFFFRFQLAPCILFGAYLGFRRGRPLPLIIGAAIPALIFAGVDTITWGSPFHFILANFFTNLVQNKASHYGVMPVTQYIGYALQYWGGAVWPLIALMIWRGKTYRVWIIAALTILVSHSFIPHKEYRFVFSAYIMLGLVAALASADLIGKLARISPVSPPWLGYILVASFWCVTSATLALSPGYAKLWTDYAPILRQDVWLYDQKDLCGLAYYDQQIFFTGGYTYMHRPAPLYALDRPSGAEGKFSNKYNYILFRARYRNEVDDAFKTLRCVKTSDWGDESGWCVARRPGPCLANAAPKLPPLIGH